MEKMQLVIRSSRRRRRRSLINALRASPFSAKRATPSSSGAGEDRLSALPDDVLVLIVLRLDIYEATQTIVLSRRWRRVRALLPELRFPVYPDPRQIAAILESHKATLRLLDAHALDTDADSAGAILRAAARRFSGSLIFRNMAPRRSAADDVEEEEAAQGGGAIDLPCFGNATSITLDLGFLGLALPPAGVFAGLTELRLFRLRFHGPCEVGDAVSSPRCPCLQRLIVNDVHGLRNLSIHSDSLLDVDLLFLHGLRQLSVVAHSLKELKLSNCFAQNQPVADIAAPQLVLLNWRDPYDPNSVQFGQMAQLQSLATTYFLVYGPPDIGHNLNFQFQRLLQRFQVIHSLYITLAYPLGIGDFEYLMEDMTLLPHITVLTLGVINVGHAFGASLFHVLRLCSGIRRLSLMLTRRDLEAQSSCPSGCICDQPTNWKTEDLLLNCLHEADIYDMKGVDHEVAFLERLCNWATVLKRLRVTFDHSIHFGKAMEFGHTLSSFCRPETILKVYIYNDANKTSSYWLASFKKEPHCDS